LFPRLLIATLPQRSDLLYNLSSQAATSLITHSWKKPVHVQCLAKDTASELAV